MPDPVSAISSISGLEPLQPLAQAGKPGEFQSVLEGTIQKLESVNNDATDAVQKFLTGESEELHTTVLAAQKAEIVKAVDTPNRVIIKVHPIKIWHWDLGKMVGVR